MIINFVGNYQTGYVGEVSDETHLARELQELGHTVNKIPRDVFKAWCEGEEPNPDWVLPIKADMNLIAKWDKFDEVDYCDRLRAVSDAPVFYWVWDYMDDQGIPEWHINMARSADLYLSGEMGLAPKYASLGIKFYYFQFDVCDGSIPVFPRRDMKDKDFNVVFTGSCLGQGHRKEWLQKINEQIPVTIFAWNPEEWFKLGFKEVYPAVYGEKYNEIISRSKVVLGMSVEPNCFGYWSNRVGKVLRANGTLLQEWAPGMESLLPNCVEYFSSPEEAVEKIKKLLTTYSYCHDDHWEFTSRDKVIALTTLMERYLKGDPDKWILP